MTLDDAFLALDYTHPMTRIVVHVADGFPILSLTLISEPLRVANRELGRSKFEWLAVSDKGGTRHSSSGLPIATVALTEETSDATILLASYKPETSSTAETLSWLRHLDRRGALLGCVDTGALVFAKAGLLGVRPAAAHPEAIAGFHRQFPRSLFVDRMFDFSPPRFSSAGGVATLDMTLALIAHFTNQRLSQRVAQILTYEVPLIGWRRLPISSSLPSEVRDAVALMEANLSKCLSVSEIARKLPMPIWKLNRLFNRYLHSSPTTYYVTLRLARARDMLRNTTLRVGDIATECGYANADVFSRAYRNHFGTAPSKDRSL